MKKKHLCLVLTLIFALLLGGCASGETADKYVGDLITSIKKEIRLLYLLFWNREFQMRTKHMYFSFRTS